MPSASMRLRALLKRKRILAMLAVNDPIGLRRK